MATSERSSKSAAIAQLFRRNISSSAAVIDEEESDSAESLSSDSNNNMEENVQDDSSDSDSSIDEEPPPSRIRLETARGNYDVLIAPSGQEWTSTIPRGGQRPARNILRMKSGITPYATSRLFDENSAFKLFLDEQTIDTIVFETNRYGRKVCSSQWKELTKDEMDAFLGLCILRGVYRAHGESVSELWSAEHGRKIFGETMSLSRFREIQRSLRFDNPETRQSRLRNDKLAAVRLLLDAFATNCQRCFTPGEAGVTVDEQLYPYRGRCRFIQYLPNKPAKYGLKFWVLNDSKTSYCWNIRMYTGKDEARNRDTPLGEFVVLQLSEELKGSGIGITVDNFFCSLSLARALLSRNMTLLGSMRSQRREIPHELRNSSGRELHSSIFVYTTEDKIQLLSYKAKPRKNVLILSSQHDSPTVTDTHNKKPSVINDYNNSKYGTDKMDQLVSSYTVKFKSRRWPVVVFCNVLDIACINAFLLYQESFPTWKERSSDRRRQFLVSLGLSLINVTRNSRSSIEHAPRPTSSSARGRCYMCSRKEDKKQRSVCSSCHRFVCKDHSRCVCCSC